LWTFAFDAPALCDSCDSAMRQKRLAVWLRDQLLAHDVPALGPNAGEEGWAFSVNADDGFVFILLALRRDGRFEARVDYAGAAEVEAEDTARAVEEILNASPAIRIPETA
jgi:hypothetical protein